jgi:hypothetical protein
MPFSNSNPASRDAATAQRLKNWNRGKDFHRVVASSRETSLSLCSFEGEGIGEKEEVVCQTKTASVSAFLSVLRSFSALSALNT